jgi:hypothetical protein
MDQRLAAGSFSCLKKYCKNDKDGVKTINLIRFFSRIDLGGGTEDGGYPRLLFV